MADPIPEGSAPTPIITTPKPSAYERLNQSAVGFFKVQESHAFVFLCVWVLFIGIVAVWSFYQDWQAGGGFMTFVVATIILFILAFCFYADWQHAKQSGKILFWKPWLAALLFPFTLGIAICSHRSEISQSESVLSGTNDFYRSEINATNYYYLGKIDSINCQNEEVTNHDQKIISQLRRYIEGQEPQMSLSERAEMMGLEEITNIYAVTNVVMATNAITLTNIVAQIQKQNRMFSAASIVRIMAALKGHTGYQISVWGDASDADSLALAGQIKAIYEEAGFNNVNELAINRLGIGDKKYNGLVLCANESAWKKDLSPFLQIFKELKIEPYKDLEGTNFADNELIYMIGPQP